MTHAAPEEPTAGKIPETARHITYLVGFVFGVLLVAAGVTNLMFNLSPALESWAVIGVGLYLMGSQALAAVFIPGLRKGAL